MLEITTFLEETGLSSLSALWFPLLMWTAASLMVMAALKAFSKWDVLYQYHIRVALIAGLPVSIIASLLIKLVSAAYASSTMAELSFIVIQNPILVTADPGTSSPAIDWSDPYLWLGTVTVLLAAVSLFKAIQLFWDYSHLSSFSHKAVSLPFDKLDTLDKQNFDLANRLCPTSVIAFTNEAEIPHTFGWKNPTIVIPSYLKDDPGKLNMAIRHELMHIKRADYLVNGFIMAVKSLCWFHPLLYLFHRDVKEYREISCDTEVLADETFSRKKYAQLLFELAPRHELYRQPVVSMSVNKSTLKKRINTMKTLTTQNRPVRKSILFSLLLLVGISGFIACSDLETSGITNSELKQAQARMQEGSTENHPLYVIREDTDLDGVAENEEIMPKTDNAKLSSIKPKYIKSITVLKGDEATQQYGPNGANGVIILTLLDKEKALTDLRSPSPPKPAVSDDFYVVVEQMPEMIGGLASLQKEIKYPQMARNAGIEGRVIIQFIVNEQGQVENPQIIRGIGGGCDEEALRAVKLAQFKPGKQRGEPVRVQYSLPIVFKLPESGSIQKESSYSYVESPKVDGKKFVINNISNDKPGVLSGTLTDANTAGPLAGANIVVQGTTIGASSGPDGEFLIQNIPPGKRELVISYIGYESAVLHIDIE